MEAYFLPPPKKERDTTFRKKASSAIYANHKRIKRIHRFAVMKNGKPVNSMTINRKRDVMSGDNCEESRFMRMALDEAGAARRAGEVPVGAVVVSEGKVIARSHNLTITLNDATAHAEMQAITAASDWLGGRYLTGCTLYVTLEPCPMCAGALYWSRVERVVFGCRDMKRGYMLYSPEMLHPGTQVEEGVLEDECSEMISSFFRERRKGNREKGEAEEGE